jgi:hypothetical protein
MSEIVYYRPGEASLMAMSIEDLRQQLASSLELSARHLMHMAAIWAELERRGEDLSSLRTGMAVYLPMIARGDLDAQIVVRYAGKNMLIRHLAGLSRMEQSQLLDNEVVTVVDFVDGDFTEKSVSLHELDSRKLKHVFGDHILSPTEQRNAIVKTRRTPVGTIIKAASRKRRSGEEEFRPLAVPMTEDEFDKVKEYARVNNVSMGALVRALLVREVKL